jgi:hypothetical protein
MSDSTPHSEAEERFIAAAVAPLADNAEMQVVAGEELRDALKRGKIEAGKAGLLAERLEGTLEKERVRLWFYGVVALISLVALAIGLRDLRRWKSASYGLIGMSDPIQGVVPSFPFHRSLMMRPADLMGDFTLAQKELLFGRPGLEPWEAYLRLHRQHPEDPVFHAEHTS